MQLISNLTNCTLDCSETLDVTSLGAALLAGLAVGMYMYVCVLFLLCICMRSVMGSSQQFCNYM